ncbi:MAG: class I SAM-dependent methyltransferase [Bacteroidota bacterium]
MTERATETFYDALSEDYHLIYVNWERAVQYQGKVLQGLIQAHLRVENPHIWDCTCGIGTQALGLAELGYAVWGSDLSADAIHRAGAEAEKRQLSLTLNQADLRDDPPFEGKTFEVIISCDNSLPHLQIPEELTLALRHIKSRLQERGLFIGSVRNYDQMLADRPTASSPKSTRYGEEEVITFQTWEWLNEQEYQFNLFILRGKGDQYTTRVRRATYRAYRRAELTDHLQAAGFWEVKWLEPEESGFHQPVFLAKV